MAGTPRNVTALRALTDRGWRPQTGIEAAQGNPYYSQRALGRALRTPADPGINLQGWINPYSLTFYQIAVLTAQPVQAFPPNLRRVYLLLQNQGPGNLYINFGQDAVAPTLLQNANCLQLITSQFYEQIGGGSVDSNGFPIASDFVSPDYGSVITDTAGTTLLIGEGVFMIDRWATALATLRGQ